MTPTFFRSFEKGVVAHLPATKLTDVASPRAYNTAFRTSEGGTLTVGRRPGFRETAALTDTLITLIAQAWFRYTETGTTTIHHIGVGSDGSLWELSSSGSTELTIPTGLGEFASATIGSVAEGVRFVQMNNVLLGFVRGGRNFKIYRLVGGSTLYVGTVGLPTPSAPTFNATAAGVMTGTIDVYCTWYNSRTDTESSPSATLSQAVTANSLTVNLPTVEPTEVDKIRVYMRKQELQTKFRRNAAMELASGTATITLNYTDSQLNQMTLSGPPTDTAFNQPPTGIRDACVHLSRVFLTDGSRFYYSRSGNGEQYDSLAEETANPDDGQLIMGLLSLTEETLGLFKERSIVGMAGQTPTSWSFDTLVPTLGCISTASLVEGDGKIGFWSEQGPCAWDKASPPRVLTDLTLKPLVDRGLVLLNRRDQCKAAFDSVNHRFLFTLDRTDSSPWTIAPWSTVHQVWEAIAWDLGTVLSLTTGPSSSSEERVFFSTSYVAYEMASRLYRDNATEASTDAYRTVVSGTVAAVVLSSGAPSVNARGSIARLIDVSGLEVHRSTYALVGTTLTWTTPSSFAPAAGDLVLFDGPVAEWDTVDSIAGSFERDKRFGQTYADVWTDGDTPILVGASIAGQTGKTQVWATTIARNNKDVARAGPTLTAPQLSHKRWLGRRARWIRLSFVGWYPLTDWQLSMLGYTAALLDDEQ
jgi:hypothetical protein